MCANLSFPCPIISQTKNLSTAWDFFAPDINGHAHGTVDSFGVIPCNPLWEASLTETVWYFLNRGYAKQEAAAGRGQRGKNMAKPRLPVEESRT